MKPMQFLRVALVAALAFVAACNGGGGGGGGYVYTDDTVDDYLDDEFFDDDFWDDDYSYDGGYDDGYYDDGYYDDGYYDDGYYDDGYYDDGYYDDGYAYDTSESTPKDLEKSRALAEDAKAEHLGKKLAAEYGLSEERSNDLAKVTIAYRKASEGRTMTEKDLAAFSTEVLGFDLATGVQALNKAELEGDRADLDQLIEKAADTNGISPEQVNDLLKRTLAK